MFRPERMCEVNLFIYEEDIQAVTQALAQLGQLQIEPQSEVKGSTRQSNWQSLAASYAAQEQQLAELLNSLQVERVTTAFPEMLDVSNDLSQLSSTLQQAKSAIDNWQRRYHTAQDELSRLRLLIEQLRLLAPLNIPVEEMTALHDLHLTVGAMPTANLTRIQTALFRIPFVIIPAFKIGTRTLVFAATTPIHAPILDRALHSAFFEPIPIPEEVRGLPAQALAESEKQAVAITAKIAELDEQRVQLAATWQEPLLLAWNRARACHILSEAIRAFQLHGQVYLIAGWAPTSSLQRLVSVVQEVSEKRAIIEVVEPDAARRQVPTLLRNPPLVRAFEGVVTTFGFPAYNEIDPTPLVGLTFVLMYGMMFGDVAHGLLLALIGFLLRKRNDTVGQLAPLLISAGGSATIFGLLYGTALGMPFLPPLWVRPLDSMIDLLLAAVIAGVVVLNLGFALQLWIAWDGRNWQTLFLDKNGVVGLLLYWALLGGGLAIWQGLLSVNLWLLLVLIPALLLFFSEPILHLLNGKRPLLAGGWGEYLVLAFFELFEAFIGYAGNSLSFVRLGAFAVAHEGLSQVVLLLAEMAGGVGWILVIALGTLVIVGFEGLIVGIQTLRLEYYEFFGKFFRGDGRPFTPLRLPELQ